MQDNGYNKTMVHCFIACSVQAITNNFAPLLFLVFQESFHLELSKITLLITINFLVQLMTDFSSTLFVDRIGYRASFVVAHFLSALGLVSLALLPRIMDPFSGLLLAVVIYAIGGGLIEVLNSPIVAALPADNKEKAMSLLHSFYCWGHVAVVLISTLLFKVLGMQRWGLVACLWALIPLYNMIAFIRVPLVEVISEDEVGMGFKELFSSKLFLILVIMMICSGASELSISQWASTFAEEGLGVSKTLGDLLGPMAFAFTMGLARLFYGKKGDSIDLDHFMILSVSLCILSYLMMGLIPHPVIGLFGCALAGFSVGIMWPGTIARAGNWLKNGGTKMYALLALGGDIGCSAGPTLAGMVASMSGDNLRMGILAATLFPVGLLITIVVMKRRGIHD